MQGREVNVQRMLLQAKRERRGLSFDLFRLRLRVFLACALGMMARFGSNGRRESDFCIDRGRRGK